MGHFSTVERGYVRCEVTADAWRADFRVVETVEQADSPISTSASSTVEPGGGGIQEA